jgi:hypothetical protein
VSGASGTVLVEVKRGKSVERAVAVTVIDGGVASVEPGAHPAPDVGLVLTAEDAAAIAAGTLDLDVAYMRGTMKMTGDPALLLQILPMAATAAFDPVRAALG